MFICLNWLFFYICRVFSTVAESVGKHLSPKSSSVVSWHFLSNALMTLIKTLLKCINVTADENIVEAGDFNFNLLLNKYVEVFVNY